MATVERTPKGFKVNYTSMMGRPAVKRFKRKQLADIFARNIDNVEKWWSNSATVCYMERIEAGDFVEIVVEGDDDEQV